MEKMKKQTLLNIWNWNEMNKVTKQNKQYRYKLIKK